MPDAAVPDAAVPDAAVPDHAAPDATAALISELIAANLSIAVAESLTGGLLAAELIRIPGASQVVTGGLVSYNTELKRTLLGVDSGTLAVHGPVHPDVAKQMAIGVRTHLAVGGRRAAVGVSTTGVAGPFAQDGLEPGTVFIGLAMGTAAWALPLHLTGDREAIRAETVRLAINAVRDLIARHESE